MALNFPAKIYQILENESTDIIRWHENEIAFRIVDHDRFEREIIPKYFRHNQISSVQRQLNLYGFKCISRGEDKGAFFHPKFKRGDWDIVRKINRFVPPKKNPNDTSRPVNEGRKTSNDEGYVFHDGAYRNTGAVDDQRYDPDGFALFSTQDGSDQIKWQTYHELNSKPEEKATKESFKPFVPPAFQPSALTSRLGYKFPSMEQVLTASRSSQAGPVKEFIIIRNNVVKINPDYDLDDAINCTYDLDVGRHSLNDALQASNHVAAQQPLPSLPAHLTGSGDISSSLSHQSQTHRDCAVAVDSSLGGRQRRSSSMDDLVEFCAEFSASAE